jgi:hypothetical protein
MLGASLHVHLSEIPCPFMADEYRMTYYSLATKVFLPPVNCFFTFSFPIPASRFFIKNWNWKRKRESRNEKQAVRNNG